MTLEDDGRRRQLVLAVNELFHDLEGEDYSDVHPEIFLRESARWRRILGQHLPARTASRTFLHIGCGTGFVGEQMTDVLRGGDTLICADISAKMLDIATSKLQTLYPDVRVRALKLSDEYLPLPDASVDVVTMNSVLHHVPDIKKFLSEISRILTADGRLFIGHEPNALFVRNEFLRGQVPVLQALRPKRIIATALKVVGLWKPHPTSDAILETINATLKERGLIDEPLTRDRLSALIDVHSPTAGGMRLEEGFDPWNVFAISCPSLRAVHVETYNHLGKLSGKHAMLEPYERMLRLLMPRMGATFFLVAAKGDQI